MIDIDLIRSNPQKVQEATKAKGHDIDIFHVAEIDKNRRELQTSIDDLRAQRNRLSIDEAKSQGPVLKEQLRDLESKEQALSLEFDQLMARIPNLPSDDTPIGPNDSANEVLKEVGEKPVFNFAPKSHWELGQELDVIDNERAAKVSGARFTYLKGKLVLLEFALIQHALSVLTNEQILAEIIATHKLDLPAHPFLPVIVPVLIKPEVMAKMARLEPKEERYHVAGDDLYLVGSAEHTLGPIHMDEMLSEASLPLRYVGFSTSFRREAGSYGKDTKGIIRLHQFDKVEMESFTTPEQSLAEHKLFIGIQEYLMQSLGIAYRLVISCTGDLGDPNARKVDVEAWMPGENLYRETHSADYMTDYQTRRLATRVKRGNGKTELAHTNDATVFAIGRTLVAIMENYQQEDGSIRVPEVLVPYVGFTEINKI